MRVRVRQIEVTDPIAHDSRYDYAAHRRTARRVIKGGLRAADRQRA